MTMETEETVHISPQKREISDWDLKDKYLRLKKKSIRKLITLPPKYLGNLNKGIEETIFKANEEIFNEFGGVPIAMGKKTLLQNVGTSIDDHPFIQFFVDLECVVFVPKVDKKVKAVVNKIGETYINCLICDRINATIFKRIQGNNIKKSQSNADVSAADSENAEKNLDGLSIGDNILIRIKSIKYEPNNIFITANFEKSL
ncbi:unnamed protein product [Brachionus calyciflorus]|uniref:Uncharacterized protein n=1 Tax=Brachionus calyciflorus TaxID=104777 RepID=A0A814KY74_9BILA|nr:unnamed protein product [Brachionus calyciflorus]